ncbi:MAG: cytochrome c-type biogenesis protein [Chloroflexota bacterium]
MRRRSFATLILTVIAALVIGVPAAFAQDSSQDVYSERTLELARKLACPVCEGQSLADSQSRLATDMKQTIESKVQAGESDQEIIDFFVARFGEEVLLEPSRSGLNLTLWWIPVIALGLGAVVVALYLRDSIIPGRSGGEEASSDGDLDEELQEIAEDALGSDAGKNRGLVSDQGAK